MPPTDSVRVETTLLPVGSYLGHPINDEDGILLLAAGVPVKELIIERLLSRGVTHVLLHPVDAAAVLGSSYEKKTPTALASNKKLRTQQQQSTTASAHAECMSAAKVAELKSRIKALTSISPRIIDIVGPAYRNRVASHGCVPYDSKQNQRLSLEFSASIKVLEEMVDIALSDARQDVHLLKSTVSTYTAELSEDFDSSLVTTAEIAPNPDYKERGIRLAMLAMAIAIELGWDEPNVREVGICGLVHDWGMFRLSPDLRNPQTPIRASDWTELSNHPLHTLELLEPMQNISPVVRLAATQVHENGDGSGYPRGLTKDQIHPYADALHVADAYISLTANMRGRNAYLSYDVIVYLLHQVKAKRMDEKAMRALLNVMSLFPLGSHVQLSDGSKAQVIRRNTARYTAPIVQRLGTDPQLRIDASHASILDLAQSDLKIAAPMPSPHRNESHIDESQYNKVLWDGTEC